MPTTIDPKARTKWKKSNISYKNYQNYIDKKEKRYDLTFIDLLYISNFKGGNATINEPEEKINEKLVFYSKRISEIEKEFGSVALASLSTQQVIKLTELVLSVCKLTLKKNENTRIDGFSTSYLSALLSAYFPNLIPILDRRVLINLGLINEEHKNSQEQIKNIQDFYANLIIRMHEECRRKPRKTIRKIDREYFIKYLKQDTLALQ